VQAGSLKVGPLLWPKDKPKSLDLGEEVQTNNTYSHQFVIYVPLTVPDDQPEGEIRVSLVPGGQICKDVCIDVEGLAAEVTLRVASPAQANTDWDAELEAGLKNAVTVGQLKQWHAEKTPPAEGIAGEAAAIKLTVWGGLGLALLAGLTLNIMPCVLPVIPLRILSIVNMAHESRRRFVTMGLAFAGGMMLFFVALAIVSALMRTVTGQAWNVSGHFQIPAIRIAMALVLVALAANLFGAFNVTVSGKIAGLEDRRKGEGHLASLGMGFMMAVLATPCSFAFLLTAMAWAQLQPLWLGTMAIVSMGIGMAGPHALLAAFPNLLKTLPRPGRWMEIFKQAMGFLLLPVALWLISTLGNSTWILRVGMYSVVLTFALWMWGSWVRYDAPSQRKWTLRGLALILAVLGGVMLLPHPAAPTTPFEAFTPDRLLQETQAGRTVLVKVTADWCVECKVLDYRVYNRPETAKMLEERHVLALKADVTDRNSVASRWLRENIGGAPPIALIYGGQETGPVRLVGDFSIPQLREALESLGKN
jgi:thiol:disulfide interchange protein